jgi:hypothetical protein
MKDLSTVKRHASNGGQCSERGMVQVVMFEGSSSDAIDE